MSSIRVRLAPRLTSPELRKVSRLLEACGMQRRALPSLRRALAHSSAIAVAEAAGEIVGFGRMLSDDTYYATLWDVAVAPDRQGENIGSRVVSKLLAVARKHRLRMVGLFTATKNDAFYERLGFQVLGELHPMTARLHSRFGARPASRAGSSKKRV